MNPTSPGSAVGAATPLTDFSTCHEGIISHLDELGVLSALLAPAVQAKRLAEETLQFFPQTVFDHHAEEEKELFPAVLVSAAAGEEHDSVQAMVEQLKAEHRVVEALWRQLEPQLTRLTKGHPGDVDASVINELVQKYVAHARFEEREFLPLSEVILRRTGDQMASLGSSLHLRRHVRDWRRHGLKGS